MGAVKIIGIYGIALHVKDYKKPAVTGVNYPARRERDSNADRLSAPRHALWRIDDLRPVLFQ